MLLQAFEKYHVCRVVVFCRVLVHHQYRIKIQIVAKLEKIIEIKLICNM